VTSPQEKRDELAQLAQEGPEERLSP
jgi:hypothetical protein